MLKCKISLKLFALICMLVCCVHGDTVQREVVQLCLLAATYSF